MAEDIRLAKAEDLDAVSESVGDLSALQTDDKSSLVAAINEVKKNGGGDGSMQNKTITQNGTYTSDYPYYGLGKVSVNVTDEWLKRAARCGGMFSHKQDIDFEEINVHNAWCTPYMFENCFGIKNMTIKGNCIDYMPGMFYNCTSLERVIFDCMTFENDMLTDRADDAYSSINISNKTNQLFAYAATAKNFKVHFKGKA